MSVFLLRRESYFCTNTLQSRSFLKNIENFLCKKMIPYKTYVQEDQLSLALYGSTTIQSRLFLKIIENFVWFPKQYLLGFFLLEKRFANIPYRGFLFLHNTLLLYSLSPYTQTERLTESQIHSLCMGWRNFLTGVSCFSKTLFYFILLALTHGRVTCRWHPKEFGSPFSVGGLSNEGAIVHTPCGLELCSPPTDKFRSGFAAADAAPIK